MKMPLQNCPQTYDDVEVRTVGRPPENTDAALFGKFSNNICFIHETAILLENKVLPTKVRRTSWEPRNYHNSSETRTLHKLLLNGWRNYAANIHVFSAIFLSSARTFLQLPPEYPRFLSSVLANSSFGGETVQENCYWWVLFHKISLSSFSNFLRTSCRLSRLQALVFDIANISLSWIWFKKFCSMNNRFHGRKQFWPTLCSAKSFWEEVVDLASEKRAVNEKRFAVSSSFCPASVFTQVPVSSVFPVTLPQKLYKIVKRFLPGLIMFHWFLKLMIREKTTNTRSALMVTAIYPHNSDSSCLLKPKYYNKIVSNLLARIETNDYIEAYCKLLRLTHASFSFVVFKTKLNPPYCRKPGRSCLISLKNETIPGTFARRSNYCSNELVIVFVKLFIAFDW